MDTTFTATDILQPEAINLNVIAKNATDALKELHAGLSQSAAITDNALFLRELLARQALGSNCLDQEVALPHVRTLAAKRIVLAVGRSGPGVAFDETHPSIRLIFLVGVPTAAASEYLRCVALLARMLRNPSLRKTFFEAMTPDEFRSVWASSMEQARR
jgi:PTS system fructose-specific IIC component